MLLELETLGVRTYRWSREKYQSLLEHGIVPPGEKVELLFGEVVAKAVDGAEEAATIERLVEQLKGFAPRTHSSLAAGADNQPEPDLLVTMDSETPAQRAQLAVEVAASTLARDRLKAAIYARANVPEYWIVNLVDETIEVHTQPHGNQYASKRTYARGERITLLAFPDVTLALDDILPRR